MSNSAARIDAITGLRGLAALLVIYGHTVEWFELPLTNRFGGEIGVTVFFALSGFLMAYLYLGKEFTAPAVTEYMIHRMARIAPAYLFVVMLGFFVSTMVDPHFIYAITQQNLLRHLLFSGNVAVFWSIPPEVEFYFLFILFWAVAYRYMRDANIAALALVVLGCLVFMAYRDVFPGTFVGSKLHYFLFGVVAGAIRSKIGARTGEGAAADSRSMLLLHAILLLAMLAMGAAIVLGHGAAILPFANNEAFYFSLLTAFFSAFVVFCFSFPSALGNAVFANRAMVFCGECSFSIYLLHMPIVYVFHKYFPQPLQPLLLLPFMALVLGLAWLNFRLVERPGARLIRSAGHALERRLFATGSLRLRMRRPLKR